MQVTVADEAPPCAINVDMKAAEWRPNCDAAIACETDAKRRGALLYGRAYSAIEEYRYDDAMADLNAALTADRDNPAFLRERAYLHGEFSHFDLATSDLDRATEQRPEDPLMYHERAFARHYLPDLQGAYDDRARELALTPDSLDALIARGEAALWLGKFAAATADAKKARSRANAAKDEDSARDAVGLLARIDKWRDATKSPRAAGRCEQGNDLKKGDAPKLIGDCTRAFFQASTGAAKADALSTRSVAWLVNEGAQDKATEDMRMALAFDPGNYQRHINLGYSYISVNHSRAASWEFDRALALQNHWLALAGRAAAKANLGDTAGARADAEASMKLEENEAATWVLADLAFDEGNRDRARELYSTLYVKGSRDDQLIERLKDLGLTDPEHALSK